MAQVDSGEGKKGSVNLHLNIVPFIDVMSCLTAFLLVTAVWIPTAELQNTPVGLGGKEGPKVERITVLVEPDSIEVSAIPADDATPIDHRQLRAADWDQLAATLKALEPSGHPRVEIAADSTRDHPVTYQTLIAAMDTTVRAGFPDVGVVDPAFLAR